LLSYWDFGGDGPPVVLLHGLAGHCGEWERTARWLTPLYRVVAPDARGHGASDRRPSDVSPNAHVADVVQLMELLGIAPVVLVGQSLGGVTALLAAARYPRLVRALVLVEASPAGEPEHADAAASEFRTALSSWPVPFASRQGAHDFFRSRFGTPSAADAWTSGLEERADGWWPRFDIDVMVETLRQASQHSYWNEWENLTCPILLVRAAGGIVDLETVDRMKVSAPQTQTAELEGARHDVHLDRPHDWQELLSHFLEDDLRDAG
jgi:pimeloyl-ACP methyl ester carboxylesterase